MFTKLSMAQRLQIGLIMAIAFLLVLGSNRLDQRHFSTIQNTVNSVYKDRVVVQDYIHQLNKILHGKVIRTLQQNIPVNSTSENERIDQLLADFKATELTSRESKLLRELIAQFENIEDLENRLVNSPKGWLEPESDQLLETYTIMVGKLDGLAEIQLEESGKLTDISKKSLGINILLSKLEVGFLIIIGIAMVALIFYPIPRTETGMRKNENSQYTDEER